MERIRNSLGAPVGVERLDPSARRLRNLDLAVLWGDLSVGLLVLAAGALLVPALGLGEAAAAIVIGSLVGSLPLALVGLAGAREGLPGMVLFRPVLGVRGSWVPSVLNVIQLVGWTALEFWAMAGVANAVSKDLLGLDSFGLWLALSAVGCTALALGGPVRVARVWLERFGVWVLLVCGAWLTWRLLSLGPDWFAPGTGGWPTFPVGIDLVIAMCVSWLPLVADYNRFSAGHSFAGTFWGFFGGNAWFFMLGALLVTTGSSGADAVSVGSSVSGLAGGALVLVLLVVAESDEAFANVYSASVSVQNLFPRARQPVIISCVAAVAAALAAASTMGAYQLFLLLLGSVFVPLFGVFFAAYFLRGRRGEVIGGFDVRALVAWAGGFLVYQWATPTGPGWWVSGVDRVIGSWLHLPVPLFGGRIGASIPGFLVSFLLALALIRRRAEAPPPPEPPTVPWTPPST